MIPSHLTRRGIGSWSLSRFNHPAFYQLLVVISTSDPSGISDCSQAWWCLSKLPFCYSLNCRLARLKSECYVQFGMSCLFVWGTVDLICQPISNSDGLRPHHGIGTVKRGSVDCFNVPFRVWTHPSTCPLLWGNLGLLVMCWTLYALANSENSFGAYCGPL